MRIAYIIQDLAGYGGMECIVSRKANYLAEVLGHEVSVITASQSGRACHVRLSGKVRFHDLGCSLNPGHPKQLYRDWEKKLGLYLGANRQDIVISTGGADLNFVHRLKDGSRKIAEYHFSFETNRYWARNLYGRRYGKTAAQMIGWYNTLRTLLHASRYDRFIVLSSADQQKWRRFINNCSYIYNSINIMPSGVEYDSNSKRVITVGRHDTQKGYDYMMQAWAKVHQKHPEWTLSIFGGGDATPTLRYIQENKLEDSVEIEGITGDIEREYRKSSLFILSSRAEGFGLVIAEAQACGLPVVTFDTPTGPGEIVNDGKDGFVIKKVGDTNSLAERITYLIENPSGRQEMSRKAVENACRFNQSTIMAQWDALFRELTSPTPNP